MFLTRCQINPASRGGRKLLGSPQAMHAAALSGFHSEQAPGRVLWRVDEQVNNVWLYLASAERPDLTHLIDQAGWPTTQAWETREYAPLLDSLEAGQRWQFRLRANPTKSIRSPHGARGKRVPHVTSEQQLSWLLGRAEGLGITLGATDEPSVAVTARGDQVFRRQGKDVTIRWATFEGALVVTDPALLRAALVQGVGPAKAYGCGMITLAPVGR